MAAQDKVLAFPKNRSVRQPLAWFCRLGTSGHRQLATLQAAGELPLRRVVVDASMWPYQQELAKTLQRAGAEIVLDTKAAELSSPSRSSGNTARAPWAHINNGKLLGPDLYRADHPADLIGMMARFAVEAGVDTVLAPGHYIADKRFADWLRVDREACWALRQCLDQEGGEHIAIDYNLLLPHTALRDASYRGEIMGSLVDLPIDNLWIRAGGFGSDASAEGTRHFIESLKSLHNLGKPIVADYLGGLTSQATVAFGAASGVAHGIAERARFGTTGWEKPYPTKDEDGGYGRATRILVPGLDKSLTIKEINLLASAKKGRRLIGCENRDCCSRGLADMMQHPLRHTVRQTLSAIDDLHVIPDDHRATHYVDQVLGKSVRQAQRIAALRPSDEKASELEVDSLKLMKTLRKHSETLDRRLRVLEHLAESSDTASHRSKPVIARHRGTRDDSSAQPGEHKR